MKFLKNGIIKLSDDIVHVVHTLEDKYEYPKLDVKLEHFRKRLVKFLDHKPTFTSDDPEVRSNESGTAYSMQLDCARALKALENISAEDNVFDIIDNLRNVDRMVNYSLPDLDLADKFFEMLKLMEEEDEFI